MPINPGYTSKRLQRSQKGFTKVTSTSPQQCHKVCDQSRNHIGRELFFVHWLRLIWSLRGFIGLREVSKRLIFANIIIKSDQVLPCCPMTDHISLQAVT